MRIILYAIAVFMSLALVSCNFMDDGKLSRCDEFERDMPEVYVYEIFNPQRTVNNEFVRFTDDMCLYRHQHAIPYWDEKITLYIHPETDPWILNYWNLDMVKWLSDPNLDSDNDEIRKAVGQKMRDKAHEVANNRKGDWQFVPVIIHSFDSRKQQWNEPYLTFSTHIYLYFYGTYGIDRWHSEPRITYRTNETGTWKSLFRLNDRISREKFEQRSKAFNEISESGYAEIRVGMGNRFQKILTEREIRIIRDMAAIFGNYHGRIDE